MTLENGVGYSIWMNFIPRHIQIAHSLKRRQFTEQRAILPEINGGPMASILQSSEYGHEFGVFQLTQLFDDRRTGAIQDQRKRQGTRRIPNRPYEIQSCGIGFKQNIGDAEFIRKWPHFDGRINSNADKLCPFANIGLTCPLKIRHFFDAGSAPACPEVNDQGPAFVGGQIDRAARQILHLCRPQSIH